MADPAGPVLLAYDGSDDAKAAIARAGGLLAPRKALVLHVWESLSRLLLHRDVASLHGSVKDAAVELDAEEAEEARRLADDGVAVAVEAGFDATGLAAEGKPRAWPAIVEIAKREDAACIVMGSRGVSGIRSAVLGSVSTGVLHHAGRPVLVVPHETGSGEGPIVIGYDGSEEAARAVAAGARLLRRRESIVVTAWVPYTDAAATALVATPVAFDLGPAERIDAEIADGAEATAEKGVELASEAGFAAAPVAERADGNIWATLVGFARERDASVLVLGSHGRTGLTAALLGSVSTGVVHHTPAPVLVVPPAKEG